MPPPAPVDVDPFELDDPNDEDPAYDSDVDYDSMDLLTLYRIPQRCRHAFRTFDGLRAFMEESTRAFGGGWGPGRQLVGVTGFSAEHLAQFDEIRDTLPPAVRALPACSAGSDIAGDGIRGFPGSWFISTISHSILIHRYSNYPTSSTFTISGSPQSIFSVQRSDDTLLQGGTGIMSRQPM
ncbi:hypothetical protein BD779DRAFT_1786462 [Infundibulicybe gibba]|nr:hypothetical protein BD779DRAFT_1786462 [Infundibulicybe gibba]